MAAQRIIPPMNNTGIHTVMTVNSVVACSVPFITAVSSVATFQSADPGANISTLIRWKINIMIVTTPTTTRSYAVDTI